MKKTFIALAIVTVVALVSVNAMARGMHGWQGNGYGPGYASQVDPKAYNDFLDATADLRSAIRADRAEMAAIMAGQNPDAKQVRALAERIDKNASAINEKAEALGLAQNCPLGNGSMGYGGMGRGMGRGMMGFNGHGHGRGFGNGLNCPAW